MHKIISFKIKSFVLGRGKITRSQSKALLKFKEKWVLQLTEHKSSANDFFERDAYTVLDIGFGMGDVLIDLALKNPNWNLIGIEVYSAGIGRVLSEIEKHGIQNIRLFEGDAVEICETIFIPKVFDRINIFFPDPWPKKKHRKRRLINDYFINMITGLLKVNGRLLVTTDDEDYHNQIIASADRSLLLKIQSKNSFKDFEGLTKSKFEKRARSSNREVYKLTFSKI